MAKGKVGAPSKYNEVIVTQICLLISEGNSLRSISKKSGMPDVSTVFDWLAKYPEFAKRYARAREEQADFLAEEILEIADETSRDYIETEDGREIFNSEHVQRSRLRVDSRKWFAAHVAPKKWGEKIAQEISGPNGGPIQTEEVSAAREQLSRRISGVASRGGKKTRD